MLRRALALLLILLPLGQAQAATADEARQFVDSVAGQVLNIINGPSGSGGQKQTQLRDVFAQHADTDWMARFVLAQGWSKATPEQQQRYLSAYREYMLARYTTNFAEYSGSQYKITDVKDEGSGQYIVTMDIQRPGKQPTYAGYRLRSDGGTFKITDIIIENVSQITTQRSEFSAVLMQGGIDKVIQALESKRQAVRGS